MPLPFHLIACLEIFASLWNLGCIPPHLTGHNLEFNSVIKHFSDPHIQTETLHVLWGEKSFNVTHFKYIEN